jgi:uncharacterized protein
MGGSGGVKCELWCTHYEEAKMAFKMIPAEEGYYAKVERERKEKLRELSQQNIEQGEREKAKALHLMKCPKCGMELFEVDFKGNKIDQCSSCHGIWLDAGELEALVKTEKRHLARIFGIFVK